MTFDRFFEHGFIRRAFHPTHGKRLALFLFVDAGIVTLVLLAVFYLQRPALLLPSFIVALLLATVVWARFQFRPSRLHA
ncbi:MAG: hypothetical protein Q8R16_04395 [bacterium]|nr:hypothetical protein [bacterium]